MSDSAPQDRPASENEPADSKTTNSVLQQQLVVYRDAVEKLKAHAARQKEALGAIQKSASQEQNRLQQELEQTRERLEQSQQARVRETALAKEKLEKLAERLKTSEDHRRELKNQLDSATRHSEELTEQVKQLQQRVARLEKEQVANDETNRFLVAKLQSEVETLRAEAQKKKNS